MASNDSVKKTITVTLLLCIVCSVIVSTAAVLLQPLQEANKAVDFQKNILAAAGLLKPGVSIEEQFEAVTTKIVDLRTGKFTDKFNPEEFEQREAATNPARSKELSEAVDIASIGRRSRYAEVYFAEDDEGDRVLILPVKGYGLWSTMYGFLALKSDLNTVVGLGFYEHGETPGLGGKITKPEWEALWPGKKVYNEQGEVALSVIKGRVGPQTANAKYKVDGLSGATLTSRGVDNLIEFWMGEHGYKPFLQNLKSGEA